MSFQKVEPYLWKCDSCKKEEIVFKTFEDNMHIPPKGWKYFFVSGYLWKAFCPACIVFS